MAKGDTPLRIWWNKNLDKKASRGKLMAHAAHAALAAYGISYSHPIVVLAAGKSKIEEMPIVIRDSGYTELEPGTVTCGVEETWQSPETLALEKIRTALSDPYARASLQNAINVLTDIHWILDDLEKEQEE